MNMNQINDELLDLLTERALGQLSVSDEKRLARLLADAGLEDNDDVELALAAAMNAYASREASAVDAAIPEALEARLLADADAFFGPAPAAVTDLDAERRRREAQAGQGVQTQTPPSRLGQMGWALAAMLALVVVFALQPDSLPEPLDPASARQALVAEANTSVIEWGASAIPAYNRVSGDVVWNDALQQGYLRLTGMPANDPTISQYQLWIVDPARDANPVDGGVFDVPAGSDEVIIPINAKLAVANPAAFAITREQPGGVVVSDGPLLVVAST